MVVMLVIYFRGRWPKIVKERKFLLLNIYICFFWHLLPELFFILSVLRQLFLNLFLINIFLQYFTNAWFEIRFFLNFEGIFLLSILFYLDWLLYF
jgi:hypothetical protein